MFLFMVIGRGIIQLHVILISNFVHSPNHQSVEPPIFPGLQYPENKLEIVGQRTLDAFDMTEWPKFHMTTFVHQMQHSCDIVHF